MGVIKLEQPRPSGMVCPRFKLSGSNGGGACTHRTVTRGCGLLDGKVPCSPAIDLDAPTEPQRLLLTGLQALATERPDGIECLSYERATATSKRCAHYVGAGACGLASEFMCVEWSKLNDPELYKRQRANAAAHLLRLSAIATTAPTAPPDPFAAPGEPTPATTPLSGAERYDGPTCAVVLNIGSPQSSIGGFCNLPMLNTPSGVMCVRCGGAGLMHGDESKAPSISMVPERVARLIVAAGCELPSLPSPRLGEQLGALKAKVPEELMTAPAAFDPAMLTDDALASLEASGIECCVTTADLGTLWLVPKHTSEDRPELTYRHARTILITMSILPGATLTAIRRRNQDKDPR